MAQPHVGLLRRIIDDRLTAWVVLAIPAISMSRYLVAGDYHRLLHPTGEFAARFMILSMMLTPFVMLMPQVGLLRWLLRRRRYIGVAAFGYAAYHTLAYMLHEGSWARIMAELPQISLWTGWLAMLLFLVLGLTSNNLSMRRFGVALWKNIQRLVYPAALFTIAHWALIAHGVGGLLVHVTPLLLLEIYRVGRNLQWWHFRFA